ncbi:Spermidine Putrescine ABC transporter permease component potC [Paraburkholderia caribensis MBA4]|uniref:Spermidine Putrescine ABC transporter permease component potC n=1 Tax=Paraburkholderia caribensis MBA4 TaxID=1323664 RepID=A0A0N7JVI9_9BURK|nr:ABC transporter permease [Paraburkholderia caribensis]ALL69341.1 Spermidine Putrescine ABC transporter permease component potC [Paraburkholderia caribensis MBA4]
MFNFPAYATVWGRVGRISYVALSLAVLIFLVLPILVVMPLSFNSQPYFTYPLPGVSLRWYQEFFNSADWMLALKNTVITGVVSTMIATVLGVTASLGLTSSRIRGKQLITGILISPMIVPLIITAVGVYFAFSPLGITDSLVGLILAHAALGAPFVVVTVTATLAGFNETLSRAGRSLGASPLRVFLQVKLPIIAPGVVSGALFAFATSFDEIVVALFLTGPDQRTIPRQMWAGIREQLSPTILAVASLLVVISTLLLMTLEVLRRRTERLRGINQSA